MNPNKSFILFLLIIIVDLFYMQNCPAQLFENIIILKPYESELPAIGRTIGGATVALSDTVPAIFGNPSSLGQVTRIKFFASIYTGRGYIRPLSSSSSLPILELKSQHWNEALSVGQAVIAIPLSLFHRPFSIAVSYDGIIPYDYELDIDQPETEYDQSNHLQRASVGIGGRLSAVRFGIGGTRFFGNQKFESRNRTYTDVWEKKNSKFNGNMFFLGTQVDVTNKLSFGAVYYLPFQLTVNHSDTYSGSSVYKEKRTQDYSGAFETGIAYQFNSALSAGLGYRYQHKFTEKYYPENSNITNKFSKKSSISTGIEYKLHSTMPLYIKYQISWLPNSSNRNYFYFDLEQDSNDELMSHLIELGGSYNYRNVTFYTATRWMQISEYRNIYYPAPPAS